MATVVRNGSDPAASGSDPDANFAKTRASVSTAANGSKGCGILPGTLSCTNVAWTYGSSIRAGVATSRLTGGD